MALRGHAALALCAQVTLGVLGSGELAQRRRRLASIYTIVTALGVTRGCSPALGKRGNRSSDVVELTTYRDLTPRISHQYEGRTW